MRKYMLAIAILWVLIFGGFIAYYQFTVQTGQEILLKTVPVDPRDLFRGDYVVLKYEISDLDTDAFQLDINSFSLGQTVYVRLTGMTSVYYQNKVEPMIATQVYMEVPKVDFYIKGTVKGISGKKLRVEYGIESYFVPEGKGREIERNIGENLYARVKVDRFGKAVLVGVELL